MTNLKGDKLAQTSFDDSTPDTGGVSKPRDAAEQARIDEDKKTAAAEKKIQQKAARVRQLAEAEAAAAANK